MLNKCVARPKAGRQAVFLVLILQAVQPLAGGATEYEPAQLSGSEIINQSQDVSPCTPGSTNVLLNGGVSVFQPHSLIGKWNGHIKRFGRHPKLFITHCQDGQIAGSYKGIFGTFPVSGQYDESTGDITIHVNFSSSRLTRLKRLRSGHGIIQAKIQNDVLVGQASISDLGSKTVRWEAVKDAKDIAVNAEKADREKTDPSLNHF